MTKPSGGFRTPLLLIAVLALVGGGIGVAAIRGQSGGPRRVEVLFLGHESMHHPSDSAATILAPVLALEGINLSYSTNPDDLNPETLALYDGLILYANHDSITPSQEAALLQFVESGKGFIPVHSASYSFRNSEAVVALMGGLFKEHGYGTFTVPITAPDHPAIAGVEPFETWDETYIHEKHNEEGRTVLMVRSENGHDEPWTWVREQGRGRVFYTAYGHDGRTWKNEGFQKLLVRGILWAVGEEVSSNRPPLPELKYAESSRIPNYERRNPPLRLQEPLSPEASMAHMQVPPGFEVQLFAAEPDIVKPIAMAWDERGRLWIAETIDYPNDIHPGTPGNDRIKILEDTNGDGRADKFTVFADSLNIPTGLAFANGGLYVTHMPDLLFLKDTDGDDRADVKEVVTTGFGYGDTHAGPSNLRYGFDNRVWGAVGYSAYEDPADSTNAFSQAIWSLDPEAKTLRHEASFSNNTWGLGFSEANDIFGSTANNTHAVYVGITTPYTAGVRGLPNRAGSQKIDGHYLMRPTTKNVRQVDVFAGFTAAAGFNLYTARAYPREYWNRIGLVSEPTGGVLHRAILERDGAGFTEKDGWNLLSSSDEWVGPVDAQVGPDGQVWVADWYNFIIQHNPTPAGFVNGAGNAYENPLRDNTHGRIYRIVYTGTKARPRKALRADRPRELVQALTDDNLFWRQTAQRLLVDRGETDVVPELIELVKSTNTDEIGLAPGSLHALWTLHGLGALDGSNAAATEAAIGALKHPVPSVRKAAVQVLPADANLLGTLQASGVLEDADNLPRVAAILRLAEVPESQEVGALLYAASTDPGVAEDRWLADGIYVAAAKHRAGFLAAFAAAKGDAGYRAVVDSVVALEKAPRRPGPPPTWPPRDAGPEPGVAVADRLVRGYIDEIAGPIERPQYAGNFGRSELPVRELTIDVVRGQMKFALPEFTVRAGQPVKITLRNTDDMQHNLLVIRPGTLDAVGALADAMVATPDAAERNYVPATPDVLAWSRLAEPGEEIVLEFRAPNQAGDYPYICTFPAHWRTMQGVMKVTD